MTMTVDTQASVLLSAMNRVPRSSDPQPDTTAIHAARLAP
ncbi:Uncharacterised protein [Escherichia coli]|nr:Uncharacterised protein [Escherichia coli]SQL83010.1 Uncharacterised protein [Escherichia coli]SQS25507.1 Uncharacterised protein [Escherichia coli]SQY61110.1 Uncharacterised protein [Escherichia coli]SQZ02177.1 Uncharacterised protein [Escherichia coli]